MAEVSQSTEKPTGTNKVKGARQISPRLSSPKTVLHGHFSQRKILVRLSSYGRQASLYSNSRSFCFFERIYSLCWLLCYIVIEYHRNGSNIILATSFAGCIITEVNRLAQVYTLIFFYLIAQKYKIKFEALHSFQT